MARKNLAAIAEGLVAAGLDPNTPAASIENATCRNQRVTAGTVATISDVAQAIGIDSPVVTIIGEVAANADSALVELPEIKAVIG